MFKMAGRGIFTGVAIHASRHLDCIKPMGYIMMLVPLLPGTPTPEAIVVLIHDDDNTCDVCAFLDGCRQKDVHRFLHAAALMQQTGVIRNEEAFRHERGKLFCFKAYQLRVACFFLDGAEKKTVVLTNAWIKKEDRVRIRHLDRADRIRRMVEDWNKENRQ